LDPALIYEFPIPIAILDKQLCFIGYSKKWCTTHALEKEYKKEGFFTIMSHIPKCFNTVLERVTCYSIQCYLN